MGVTPPRDGASTPPWAGVSVRPSDAASVPSRLPLGVLPTPVVAADRLRAALGCGPVLVKRDDLLGFGVAGNKTRTLEVLLADAVARDCDLLVTGGGPDSNFVPAAALAARVAGLDCEVVAAAGADRLGTTNLALARAAGAVVHPLGDGDRDRIDAGVEALADRRAREGRRPVAVPRGGSTPLGAAGFARAATELHDQLPDAPALVVLSVGSGGSVAGLHAGLDPGTRILGVSVSRDPVETTARVRGLARGCAELLGLPEPDPSRLEIVDGRGPGFGVAGAGDRAAAGLALHTEGLLLDDTYGAKAFAVLVARLRSGVQGTALYWHTGGVASALSHVDELAAAGEGVR